MVTINALTKLMIKLTTMQDFCTMVIVTLEWIHLERSVRYLTVNVILLAGIIRARLAVVHIDTLSISCTDLLKLDATKQITHSQISKLKVMVIEIVSRLLRKQVTFMLL